MNLPAAGRRTEILLSAINAKWIHPSLALRLLKANLGPLEEHCEIIEFALRQPLEEKVNAILAARPCILGLSVAIWNHTATLELLKALQSAWQENSGARPVVVLGGPEVSYLPDTAEIFSHADFCIRGEGETAFRTLCQDILKGCKPILEENKVFSGNRKNFLGARFVNNSFEPVAIHTIKSGYRLYTDEDLRKKLVYVEASRGCPCGCEFCLDSIKKSQPQAVREFPLEPFLAEIESMIRRGARIFKFLDRSFNWNIERARRIMEFFLAKAESDPAPFTVHFETVPSRFPQELCETVSRFPSGILRLELGIQTLNREVSARICRPSNPEQELETLRFLHSKTKAIIHADLIAGLPGEDMVSFGRGFDRLWAVLSAEEHSRAEIQLGILKLLPGAPIARHTKAFGMRYNPSPPYEVLETAAIPTAGMDRIKNFARFWELIVNRGLMAGLPEQPFPFPPGKPVFERFMHLSGLLLDRFRRNWGIAKNDLRQAVIELV
jgi:radical SAM superfamily enzyme YgiQ (UPF0313 family)